MNQKENEYIYSKIKKYMDNEKDGVTGFIIAPFLQNGGPIEYRNLFVSDKGRFFLKSFDEYNEKEFSYLTMFWTNILSNLNLDNVKKGN